jgi:hypothetical protein
MFRDKLIDLENGLGGQMFSSLQQTVERVNQGVEEIHDMMDYFQEIFDCDNREVSDLMSNALLYYCYLPAVLGSIVSESKPLISISTAEYLLI